jgi:hypothetical protein
MKEENKVNSAKNAERYMDSGFGDVGSYVDVYKMR